MEQVAARSLDRTARPSWMLISCARPVRGGENCTGLAQVVGQFQGSNRDFQSKRWAKPRNLGPPCALFVRGRTAAGA
jgi:hypothetical protein